MSWADIQRNSICSQCCRANCVMEKRNCVCVCGLCVFCDRINNMVSVLASVRLSALCHVWLICSLSSDIHTDLQDPLLSHAASNQHSQATMCWQIDCQHGCKLIRFWWRVRETGYRQLYNVCSRCYGDQVFFIIYFQSIYFSFIIFYLFYSVFLCLDAVVWFTCSLCIFTVVLFYLKALCNFVLKDAK